MEANGLARQETEPNLEKTTVGLWFATPRCHVVPQAVP